MINRESNLEEAIACLKKDPASLGITLPAELHWLPSLRYRHEHEISKQCECRPIPQESTGGKTNQVYVLWVHEDDDIIKEIAKDAFTDTETEPENTLN